MLSPIPCTTIAPGFTFSVDITRVCFFQSFSVQAIFEMDKSCYMACIFTGLAYLKLGNTASSKQYYKRAIELQPDEKLGWKVRYSQPKFIQV